MFFKEIAMKWLAALALLVTNMFAQEMPVNHKPVVIFETTQGTIELTLMPDVAPKACENFIGLVERHFYDGITFHRVIKSFMLQCGDPTGTGAGGQSIWNRSSTFMGVPALNRLNTSIVNRNCPF